MNFTEFEKLIADMKADSDRTHQLYDLGIDIINYDTGHSIVTALGIEAFGKDHWDTITWWLFERKDNGEPQMWDKDNNPLCVDLRGLYDYVNTK